MNRKIEFRTQGNTDIINLTDQIRKLVLQERIENGLILIFTPSSTSAITTTEFESGCVEDLRDWFKTHMPDEKNYAHNARWGDGNGHSHLRASIIGASFSCPIIGGQLYLGTWQQIIFIDFDVRPRNRTVIVQLVGE